MEAALELVSEADFDKAMAQDNTVAAMRRRYQAIKPDFGRAVSWDQGVGGMVKELGEPYTLQYMACYAIPNFSIHATLASSGRWEGSGNSESEAEFVVFNAMWVFITVLESQSRLFELNLQATIEAFWQDFMADYVQH